MNRQDLIVFSRDGSPRRIRMVLGTVLFMLAWLTVLFWGIDTFFDRLDPLYFVAFAAVPIIALIAVAGKMFSEMPKCPHCGTKLIGPLLPIAVASGNCGHCGRSIED